MLPILRELKNDKIKFIQTLLIVGLVAFAFYSSNQYKFINQKFSELDELKANLDQNFEETLFEEHLVVSEKLKIEAERNKLKSQLDELLTDDENSNYFKTRDVYEVYELYTNKIARNEQVLLDVSETSADLAAWGLQLLNQEFGNLENSIKDANSVLDSQHKEYIDSLPPPPTYSSADGYSYQTVNTERGTFGVYLLKVPLNSVKVLTASASDKDCNDNCAAKPLAQHVADNGGFAGLNGSYFCPPDYSECSGKINSSDYAFYKSSSGKWLNDHALSWGDTGLATFNGNSAKFYKRSSDYGGGSVTAGISNYPTLLDNGKIAIDEGILTSYQKTSKGPRGFIGVGKTNLYIGVVASATVIDAGYAVKALGALDALNLDGGGSTAMYVNGSYILGPGRSLPNAVVLVK